MAINQEIPINVYNGDGVTTGFTGEFTVATGTDLAVYVDAVKKSESTDYTITGLGTNPFSITFATPPATGSTVLLKRIIVYNRLNDYQEGGDLLADTLDGDLDRIVSQMQQLAAIIDPDYSNVTGRALAAPIDGIGGVFSKSDFDNRQSTIVGYNSSKELTLYPQTQSAVTIQTYHKTSDYASVEAMVATLVGGPHDVIIDSNIGCTTDCTIPETIRLIRPTGTIDVATGKTLTINGSFSAGLYQVFSGSGSVVFGAGTVTEVYPEWWGAKSDDATDCNSAFTKANATGIHIKLSKGAYKIIGELTIDVSMSGIGVTPSDTTQGTLLYFYGCSDATKGALNTRWNSRKHNPIVFSDFAIYAKSWTECLGYGLDIEARVTMRNIRVSSFKKSNIWMHNSATSGQAPYFSHLENVASTYSGNHGLLIGMGASLVTLINYQGAWNGATAFGVAPVSAGIYDGFHVDATADGGAYASEVIESLTVIGGDCSYNSRHGWHFKAIQNSTALFPGYAEGNLQTGGYQAFIGRDFVKSVVRFAKLNGDIAAIERDPYSAYVYESGIYYANNEVSYLNTDVIYSRVNQTSFMSESSLNGAAVAQYSSSTSGDTDIKMFSAALVLGNSIHRLTIGDNFIGLPIAFYQATNYAPWVIVSVSNLGGKFNINTGGSAHGYNTGDRVFIRGVVGNNCNGLWYVTKIDATNFTLDGSTFTGSYLSGGEVKGYVINQRNAAAPSAGQYAIGDRMINSAPAVGQPKAWTCTVSGSPGTWVSEGNL